MAILGLLEERDLHGYEIRRRCASTSASWPTSRSAPSTRPSPAWRSQVRSWPPRVGRPDRPGGTPPRHRVPHAASSPLCAPGATPRPGSPRPQGLPDHRRGPAALRRAARGRRHRGRRAELRAPPGLRPPPGPPGSPALLERRRASSCSASARWRRPAPTSTSTPAPWFSTRPTASPATSAGSTPSSRPNAPTSPLPAPNRRPDEPAVPTRRRSFMSSPIRVAIAGVGNCASSLVQGITYYRDAEPDDIVPGLMHVELGGYHVRDLESVAAFDVDPTKVGTDLGKAIDAGQNNTLNFADVGELGGDRAAGSDARRPGQVLPGGRRRVARRARRRRPGPARRPGRRPRLLPAGRLRGGPALLRPGLPRRGRRLRQRHPRLHRLGPRVGEAVPRRRRADRRRRHQEPGGRHHRAPRADPPLRGPRPDPGPHLPAQRRRQHGLQEHARARAPRVEEDLQDPGRHQPARGQRPRRRRRAHRARPTTCPG